MLVETTRFGVLDVAEEQILAVEGPVPPFDLVTEYVILGHRAGPPFHWLQAVRVPGLAFIVAPPQAFFRGYPPAWGARELEQVGARHEAEALTLVILNPQKERGELTANLLAPLLIGRLSGRGCQAILTGNEYDVRAPIWPREKPDGRDEAEGRKPPHQVSA